jgi:hypothetical protein
MFHKKQKIIHYIGHILVTVNSYAFQEWILMKFKIVILPYRAEGCVPPTTGASALWLSVKRVDGCSCCRFCIAPVPA